MILWPCIKWNIISWSMILHLIINHIGGIVFQLKPGNTFLPYFTRHLAACPFLDWWGGGEGGWIQVTERVELSYAWTKVTLKVIFTQNWSPKGVGLPVHGVGLLSITLNCAVKECFKFMPLLLPCNVTRRYWPVEYTGYGLAVPQNVPSKGEILVIKVKKGSLL